MAKNQNLNHLDNYPLHSFVSSWLQCVATDTINGVLFNVGFQIDLPNSQLTLWIFWKWRQEMTEYLNKYWEDPLSGMNYLF